ncbi:MAG TPA: hypothetical protein VG122_20400 [Gemmata sp.]|jgi:hypothetical protein|nr:hypothetical protein [Gemmata sp.]
MRTAFLLRFQEFCVEEPSLEVSSGTATNTRVRAEQPDTDTSTGGHSTFPRSVDAGGTKIKNSIDRESGGTDADRSETQIRAVLLPATGTATRTKVKREQPDLDSEAAARAIPWPTTAPIAQTKTVTYIRAEADDSDPRQASLNAIPKCS